MEPHLAGRQGPIEARGKIERALSTALAGRAGWSSRALLAPAGVWLTAFLLLPTAFVAAISLVRRGPYGALVWRLTAANYLRALDSAYAPVLGRSLLYAAAATALCLAAAYPVAYGLAMHFRRRRDTWLALLMLPFWTSPLVGLYSWMILLGREGLLNEILVRRLGWWSEPARFLNRPAAVIGGLAYFYLPFMLLPLYASLEKLPRSYIEAAKDLGAGSWSTFRRVTLPLSLPGVLAGAILTFVPCVGDFLTAEFLGGPDTYLVGNLIQGQFQTAQDWPFGAALATLLVAALSAAVWLYQRLEGERLETGRA